MAIGWVQAAGAAPLPAGEALDRPVSLAARQQAASQVLEQLSKAGGVALSVDEHVASSALTLSLRNCPLRDAMTAIAGVLHLEWEGEGEGGFRLRGPVLAPPAADIRRLMSTLAVACPQWMRPPFGGVPPDRAGYVPPPMGALYGSLNAASRDVIEDGGELPFAQLQPAARRVLVDYHRDRARRDAAGILNPRWLVPANALGLRIRDGQGGGWQLVAQRQAAPPQPAREDAPPPPPPPMAWDDAGYIPFQPGVQGAGEGAGPGGGTRLVDAALAAAQKAGAGVVMRGFEFAQAGEAAGETAADMLKSILPEPDRASGREWKASGNAYWLHSPGKAEGGAPSPDLARSLRALEGGLPAEYRPLLAMDGIQRSYAVRAPWARLWHSLTEEQRKPGPDPLVVANLTQDQQTLLSAALQAQIVDGIWRTLQGALGSDLQRSTLSLDFETARDAFMGGGMGSPRTLVIREGNHTLLEGAAWDLPPILRLLPTNDAPLSRHGDLAAKDEPMAAVAERLSEVLRAPVVVQEPEKELKLTCELAGKPVRLLMHWVERHSSLVWCKREGVYVLAAPIPTAALSADPKRTMAALARDVPPQLAANAYAAVRQSLTQEDRAALQAGTARFSDLSPGVQEALRGLLQAQIRNQVNDVDARWQLAGRIQDARIRVEGVGGRSPRVRLEIPGMPPQLFALPQR